MAADGESFLEYPWVQFWTLPRALMEQMPEEWQERMRDCLEELDANQWRIVGKDKPFCDNCGATGVRLRAVWGCYACSVRCARLLL